MMYIWHSIRCVWISTASPMCQTVYMLMAQLFCSVVAAKHAV